ncbi:L-aspartate oxidase [Protaetiibacter intestinalis]|uniref:L-aspartate oxidase n=1 Tax=Protaetiibacter intestinalis TaxID=2419774 RepID=A0A387BB22_9MICO|nr:L-aspartate oxidase [Protaetiibacter intestinalis]AYF98908.1 L-aspartate oxidase [Protaetiibacter intestinalis]
MRVVVVGSGIAGLVTAWRASARHEVVLVTKGELTESNTRHAQGGIAAALFPDDSAAAHASDTLRAGAGLADPEAVRVLCTEGPARVRELVALGVPFDRDPDGALARGREAAHGVRRVLHAGGDATGRAIEATLIRAVRATTTVVHEHTSLRELLVDAGRVVGALVRHADGTVGVLGADAVVIATGGAGRLYAHTTNPAVTTGDGIAAAYRAGAELADLEFMQFHPTALAVPGRPLVSEAVRGEGAVLLDAEGRRFLTEVHADAELAPRDVVARGVARAMARQDGAPVLLDAARVERERGDGYLAARFPSLTRLTREHGLDWRREPVPVTPAAHFWMGGIRTDLDGRTSLPGLFAVGEAARTGVHGANRLASNSLLEGLVFGHRVAQVIEELPAAPTGAPLPPAGSDREPVGADDIRALMWSAVGLERDGDTLAAALRTLEGWNADGETRGLLELARLTTRAALARTESRGAHFRTDHPDTDPAQARPLVWSTVPTRELEPAR